MTNISIYHIKLSNVQDSEKSTSIQVDNFTLFSEIIEEIRKFEGLNYENFDLVYQETRLYHSLWFKAPLYFIMDALKLNPYETRLHFEYTKQDSQNFEYHSHSNIFSQRRSGALSREDNNSFVGLINSGNTCYLNSLLQALYMTPEFRNEIYEWELDEEEKEKKDLSIPYQLQKLFCRLQFSRKYSIDTTPLTKSFRWVDENILEQQDIHELCRIMFDALENKLIKKERIRKMSESNNLNDQSNSKSSVSKVNEQPPTCFINQYFGGKSASYVKCDKCNNFSFNDEEFLDIQVPLTTFENNSKPISNLVEAFEIMEREETLDKENLYFCEKCQVMTEAKRGSIFNKMPQILSLQLLRFTFNFTDLSKIKLQHRFEFPLDQFDCTPFIRSKDDLMKLSTADYATLNDKRDSMLNKNENCPEDEEMPDKELIDDLFKDTSNQKESVNGLSETTVETDPSKGKTLYQLFSIMVHSGTVNKGHYYSYIRDFDNGQWYCFNDQNVTKVTEEKLEETFGNENSSRSAYFLWYRKIDQQTNQTFLQEPNLKPHMMNLVDRIRKDEAIEMLINERNANKKLVEINFKSTIKSINLHPEDTLAQSAILVAKSFEVFQPEKKYRLVLANENFQIIASASEIIKKLNSSKCDEDEFSEIDLRDDDELVTVGQTIDLVENGKFILEEEHAQVVWTNYHEEGFTFRIIPISDQTLSSDAFDSIDDFIGTSQVQLYWLDKTCTFAQLFRSIAQKFAFSPDSRCKGVFDAIPHLDTAVLPKKTNLIDLEKGKIQMDKLIKIYTGPIPIYFFELPQCEDVDPEKIFCNVAVRINLLHHFTEQTVPYPANEKVLPQVKALKKFFLCEDDDTVIPDVSMDMGRDNSIMDVDEEHATCFYDWGYEYTLELYNNRKFFSDIKEEGNNRVRLIYPKTNTIEQAFGDFFRGKFNLESGLMQEIEIKYDESIQLSFSVAILKVAVIDLDMILREKTLEKGLKLLTNFNLKVDEYYQRLGYIWPRYLTVYMKKPVDFKLIPEAAKKELENILDKPTVAKINNHLLVNTNNPLHFCLHIFQKSAKLSLKIHEWSPRQSRFLDYHRIIGETYDEIQDKLEAIIHSSSTEPVGPITIIATTYPYLVHSGYLFDYAQDKCESKGLNWATFDTIDTIPIKDITNSECLVIWMKQTDLKLVNLDKRLPKESELLRYVCALLNQTPLSICRYND